MDLEIRNMLILQNNEKLQEQQQWLFKAYSKMLFEIVKRSINPHSSIDPFASEYYGKNSVRIDQNYYHSLLEITSYFWASKAGRGTLLEKTIRLLSGSQATQNVFLSDFLNSIIQSKKTLNGRLSEKFKIKVDLINFVDDKLIILEIKNRIDSGGADSRRSVLNKFFGLCDIIENNTVAFTDRTTNKEYTLPELLEKLGISKFEMLMGLLYNISGTQAKISDDKNSGGWYGESKKLTKQYVESHIQIGCDIDNLKIDFEKNKVKFVIQTVYGSDTTKRFTGNKLTLDNVFDSVFPKSWDDIWLGLNVGIEQRRILLEHKINHITEIKRICKTNSDFKKELEKFKLDSTDLSLIKNMVDIMQKNVNPILSKSSDQDIVDCLYLCSRFVN